ncbi:Transcriptional regulatory protein moc3 [Colletotrichum gloeosporioides]|uniref:Transcriptional regulatory protein moc3 n=1 Tax=Colletotrichum gloeosporioides TaxID=474922 RepID=A0A8H4CDV5_COLGL|nr:Transcriptional regulatory protein moc3 [Colletotrichum gloeosporioides]KAF3801954.1 Transcriptional regulatory protein moc3 [Colletotrichum gloeosporioides]
MSQIPSAQTTGGLLSRKCTIQSRPKVKSGCVTCRTRKIKCDEEKPFCHRCTSTGRTCDGYESPFRLVLANHASHSGGAKSSMTRIQSIRPTMAEIAITPEEINILSRYFSTKTIFDVDLACDKEARQILQASFTDPSVRLAVSSLKAFRKHLETSGDFAFSSLGRKSGREYDYGVQQYCLALKGLAFKLSSPGSDEIRSALLCCQIFLSIEQVRGNYSAVAQHLVQGLSIMHEYRARPSLVAADNLIPASHSDIPLLDVFVIKLFIAPCKFADSPASTAIKDTASDAGPVLPDQQSDESESVPHRPIAPNMRKLLTKIASNLLEFLSKVSNVESVAMALVLLSEKASLLDSLDSWYSMFERVHLDAKAGQREPLSVSFLRLFYRTLKIVLLGAIYCNSEYDEKRLAEIEQLRSVADSVEDGLKTYRGYKSARSKEHTSNPAY